jgi:ABC-type antimicrobial peptide transport system permease subunit
MIHPLVGSIDPSLPVEQLKTMPQQIRENIFLDRMISILAAAFAGIATLLAAIGLYGVLAYTVAQRTREIGVRMALGAGRRDISRLVLRQGFVLAAVGIVVGLVLAFLVTRLMVALLFEVSPTDPPIFASVPALLAAIALLACYIPARRAASVEPLEAIRAE